jgi:hypothetical protein
MAARLGPSSAPAPASRQRQRAPGVRCRAAGGAAGAAARELDALRTQLPAAAVEPAALAALVERAAAALGPELPGVRAAFERAALLAGAPAAPSASVPRPGGGSDSSPWGGPTGGGGGGSSPWGGPTGGGGSSGGGGGGSPWGGPTGSGGGGSGGGSSGGSSAARLSPWGGPMGGSSSGAAAAGGAPWSWAAVRRLQAYGLGSLAEYAAGAQAGGGGGSGGEEEGGGGAAAAAAPKRAAMRLAQWGLLLALQRGGLLPGLAAAPRASDPGFGPVDVAALRLLGVEGVASDELQG